MSTMNSTGGKPQAGRSFVVPEENEPARSYTGPVNTPVGNNSRGRRSREEILQAAARVMAARGYAGTSMSELVKETGIPLSAIYHHFESKAGLLAAVMAEGAHRFFAGLREVHENPPAGVTSRALLTWYLQRTCDVFVRRSEFIRLLLVLVMSDEATDGPEASQTVITVRNEGREHMRHMIYQSFLAEGAEYAGVVADELAHFGMAGFDGAFVSFQSEDGKPMREFVDQLADALHAVATRRIGELRARKDAS